MHLDRSDVHVAVLASCLGRPVSIRDLDDARVRANLGGLEEQGIESVRMSDRTTVQLAVAVTPGAPGGPPADEACQAAVVCTDTLVGTTPTEWLLEFREAAGLGPTRTVFVSGSGCANFAAGLDVARGLIASGAAESVLLVTVDKVLSGTRHPTLSMTVFSDGAVSCLVSAAPRRAAFRLVSTATQTWPDPEDEQTEIAHARTILTATRAAAKRVTDGSVANIRHMVTPNFGAATRQLLAMAIPLPSERLYSGLVSEVGHCFAADVPLNLDHLARSHALIADDTILAVASSSNTLSVMLFRYQP